MFPITEFPEEYKGFRKLKAEKVSIGRLLFHAFYKKGQYEFRLNGLKTEKGDQFEVISFKNNQTFNTKSFDSNFQALCYYFEQMNQFKLKAEI